MARAVRFYRKGPCQLLPNAEMEDRFLTLHTTLAPEALKEKLQRWEPWSHRFDFDNGMSTRDCARLTPFNERPGLAGASSEFKLGSAETFSRPREFDVVLHFGTLYHLPNPLLSLRQSFENLKPGGYLALETQVYDHPQDPNICYFMHMQNNDPTNFWALSTPVLKKNLELIGFTDVREVKKIAMPILAEHMARILIVARKPAP